jgi:hypothetical protein
MMLLRDLERLADCRKRMNRSPIGCCALAGTTYDTDRDYEAKNLGFDGLCLNSLDGVSDRDFCAELMSGLAILMNDIEVTSRTYFTKPGCVLDMSGHTIFNGNPEIARTAFAIRVDSGGSLTIKGNGKFVDNHTDKDLYYSPGIFCVSGVGSVLTVEGGYFDAGNNDNGNMLVQAQSNGTFVIRGGTFENNGSQESGDFLYAMSGATIEIHDGFFRNDGSYDHTINVNNGRPGKVIVKGGTFVNHWPGKTMDPGLVKVAEGYAVISEVQPNGETWYTVVPVAG